LRFFAATKLHSKIGRKKAQKAQESERCGARRICELRASARRSLSKLFIKTPCATRAARKHRGSVFLRLLRIFAAKKARVSIGQNYDSKIGRKKAQKAQESERCGAKACYLRSSSWGAPKSLCATARKHRDLRSCAFCASLRLKRQVLVGRQNAQKAQKPDRRWTAGSSLRPKDHNPYFSSRR
jgi:hypothetical protein